MDVTGFPIQRKRRSWCKLAVAGYVVEYKVEARPPKKRCQDCQWSDESVQRSCCSLLDPFDAVHFSIRATMVVFAAVIVVVGPSPCPFNLLNTLHDVDPEVLQSGFKLKLSCWSGEFEDNGPQVAQRILPAIFSALLLQSFRPSPTFTPRIVGLPLQFSRGLEKGGFVQVPSFRLLYRRSVFCTLVPVGCTIVPFLYPSF